jgi:hypothetical protein
MKAAIISNQVVQNIIVWDDTCQAPDGFDVAVLEDHVQISIGWVRQGNSFADPNPPTPAESVPIPTVYDLRAQLDMITAQLVAIEAN